MTPEQYCIEKVYHTGNDLYYSCLYLESDEKQAIINIYAYYQTIFIIPHECQEQAVAEKKLAFWVEEIENLFSNRTIHHPITKAIKITAEKYKIPKQLFLGIIDGTQNYLLNHQIDTFEELVLHAHQTTSLREMIITYILKQNDTQGLSLARDCGVCCRIIEIIQRLRLDIAKSWLYLPKDLLKTFNVMQEDLLNFKADPKLEHLLLHIATKAIERYQSAINETSATLLYSCHPIMLHTQIQISLIKKIKRKRFNVLNYFYRITPIKKYIIISRSYRHLKRNA